VGFDGAEAAGGTTGAGTFVAGISASGTSAAWVGAGIAVEGGVAVLGAGAAADVVVVDGSCPFDASPEWVTRHTTPTPMSRTSAPKTPKTAFCAPLGPVAPDCDRAHVDDVARMGFEDRSAGSTAGGRSEAPRTREIRSREMSPRAGPKGTSAAAKRATFS
jgi:hypothetical protein